MPVEFEIELIKSPKKDRPYIIARHLMPGQPFDVPEDSFLNDIEIISGLSSPRAMDENGNPRFDFYLFYPRYKKDIELFEAGMVVKLTNRNQQPPDKPRD